VQLEPLTDQLLAYLRDLMVLAAGAETLPLSSVSPDCRAELTAQAQTWGLQTVVASLELLAETKSRMQRTTYGRALLELALVRISLLQDLDRLDELIGKLKGLPANLSAGKTPGARSPAGDTGQKKTPELLTIAQVEPPTAVPDEQVVAEPQVFWQPNCGPELLERLKGRFADIIGAHLSRVMSTAIPGPNDLEFIWPTGYDISRKACERPEVVATLEAALRELTGRAIRLKFSVGAAPGPSVAPVPLPANSRRRTVDAPEDPLVEEIGRILGVPTWQVQEGVGASAAAPTDGDE
jgi:DNA polymerase-3 subunit gamma/tau